MELGLVSLIQALVAGGLVNVWLVRARMPTAYRGGDSTNLFEEFRAYGLPAWVFYLVGFLKVFGAITLLAGVFFTDVILPTAGMLTLLMLAALAMHVKIGDSLSKMLPALSMLGLCIALVYLTY